MESLLIIDVHAVEDVLKDTGCILEFQCGKGSSFEETDVHLKGLLICSVVCEVG